MKRPAVTRRDRLRCFITGHDVHDWGTCAGWCRRCHHTIMTGSPRTILIYGKFKRWPPAHHDEETRRAEGEAFKASVIARARREGRL